MTGILNLLLGAGGVIKDTYFNLVSLLLPGNGTNGAQNNTFLDSSSNTFTITRNGNTTQGTFSPFSQTGWGNRFDGVNGTALSIPYSSNYANFGTGDFTIECWLYQVAQVQYSAVITSQNTAEPSGGWILGNNNSDLLSFYVSGTFYLATDFTSYFNKWTHVAVVRQSGTLRLYINGVQQTTASVAGSITGDSANAAIIGRRWTNDNRYVFNGYISNLRIVKGTCLYNSGTTFTPSTTPLTAVSGTGLLTCQSNRFKDNSSNDFTITPAGNVAITPFSPFAPTAAYSAAAVGGSGYFDGTGDYLTAPNNTAFDFGSGDLTIEAWIFPTANSGANDSEVISYGQTGTLNGWHFGLTGSGTVNRLQIGLNYSGYLVTSTGVVPLNTWSHVAATRSGTTWRLFINGVQDGTTTSSTNPTVSGSSLCYIGTASYDPGAASRSLTGYISNARVLKGTAVYTGSFTPPTKPVATSGADSASSYPSTTNVNTSFASSACSLLLNFTNAGVVDATAKNVLETVGNAQISTTQSKWGGGSIYFDGTGSPAGYLSFPDSPTIRLGSSDFVFECWARFDDFSSTRHLCFLNGNTSAYAGLRLGVGTDSKIFLLMSQNGSTFAVSSGAIGSALSANTWYYIAVQRSSAGVKVFVDGSQIGITYSLSGSVMSGTVNYIGEITSVSQPMKGYMDDVRLTLYARTITASPTAPFPVQ